MPPVQVFQKVLIVSLLVGACGDAAGPSDTGSLRFMQISAGYSHSCALATTGKVYCWGSNTYGQVGASLNGTRGRPVAVSGGHLFTSVSAGWLYTCGVGLDGTAYCWGGSSSGAAGPIPVGNTCSGLPCALSPQAVAGSNRFLEITTGYSFTCGRLFDQRVYCWGGTQVAAGLLADTAFVRMSGSFPGCAVANDSTAYCWGPNTRGRVGDSTLSDTTRPVQVYGGLEFLQVESSVQHSCGLVSGGAVYCWGFNDAAQFGLGSTDELAHPVPEPAGGGLLFVDLALDDYRTCGIAADQVAYCWGSILGVNQLLSPTPVPGGLKFLSLSLGYSHSCGIATDSLAYCWGAGAEGQLGVDPQVLGPTVISMVPVLVSRQIP